MHIRKRSGFLVLLTAFLIIDVSLILLRLNEYYFVNVEWSIPVLIHTILFVFWFMVFKRQLLWVPFLCTVLLFFWWSITYVSSLILGWNNVSLHSPMGTEALIIKYRAAAHGSETNYFYEFYQKGHYGALLMRKIGDEDLYRIVVFDHKKYPDAIEALGAANPKWINEKAVIFHTQDRQKQISLK